MPTIWKLSNFGLGQHTDPGKVRGGSRYAADMSNLAVDENGWLTLRSNFKKIGPGGSHITGLDASNEYLFVLRSNGKLYYRPLDDITNETEIPGVYNLSGRLSVISDYRDYIILTSEGTDQGFWVDLREGKSRRAHTLGINKPENNAFTLTNDRPSNSDPTALVAYVITYTRQFEAGLAEVPPDELFNGMESEPSAPQYVLTSQVTDDESASLADNYLGSPSAEWRYESVIGNLTDGEVNFQTQTFSVRFKDRNGKDWETEIRAANLVGKVLRVLNQSHPGRYIRGVVTNVNFSNVSASIRLTNITATMASGSSSQGDRVKIAIDDANSGRDINPGDYYPSVLSGFVHSTDSQVTGINIYRSYFYKKDNDADTDGDFSRLEQLINDDVATRDFSTLPFRKILYVPRGYNQTVIDGVRIVDEKDQPYVQGKDYTFTDQDTLELNANKRLPSEVKQFYLYTDRVWGAAGDRLVYSDLDYGNPKLWAFPTKNAVRRSRPGRIDFVAEHREVVLFGGRDGLYRLAGLDPSDFNPDEISRTGPLDGYSWNATIDALGYVGENGFYLTDAANTQFVSKLAIDKFFKNKRAVRGTILFFSDDTFLFSVGLQHIESGDITDYIFRYDDGYWSRWKDQDIRQAVAVGEEYTQYWIIDGTSQLNELEWNEDNESNTLPFSWESNWIHGRSQGVQNLSKQFNEFCINAESGTPMKLLTWVDNETEPTIVEFTTREDDLYNQYIPIQKIGRRLKFRLEGTGKVLIRGIAIES